MDRQSTPSIVETVASESLVASSISQASAGFEDEGRFPAGTLLGGRYRILGLLGRGGMGEVYRATDLTLGQSVALKFLPAQAAGNQRLLERFHGEVRVARLVSHPNVCRLYDIGAIDGMPFISMEYVDGEDLASLLTRIGRLPADKALDTARKLCAGLGAAHDRGIIHRDLKPHNIMMNRRGEVVIMDFGLAAIADQLTGEEARNGTPAYMSPEQLKGAVVTARSDIYALGLVLYELFTGKRPYDAATLQQMIELQESARLTSMTSVAADIDPAVEEVIRRCLNPDPAKRPSSVLGVLAQLPGGDPLARAMAAGETPSPEMLAAAGTVEGMPRRYSIPCLAIVAACLFGTIPIREVRTALVHAPLVQSPEVLAHEARRMAESFGYGKRAGDSAVWLEHRPGLLGYLRALPRPRKWDEWFAAEAPLAANYRESPAELRAEPFGYVTGSNPPFDVPGMVRAELEGNGRLRDFTAVPLPEGATFPSAADAASVFHAAGLDMAAFREVPAELTPASAFDTRQAWMGPHPGIPGTELRLEAAWWQGRIVRAKVFFGKQPVNPRAGNGTSSFAEEMSDAGVAILLALGALFALLRAVSNWRQQRADPEGARRIAVASFLLSAIAWMGSVHAATPGAAMDLMTSAAANWLISAAALWMAYLALEPEVRARWPHSIVTWKRVLDGRWLDAQVGSHVLIGAAVGSGLWAAFKVTAIFLMRTREPNNWDVSLHALEGTRQWIGTHAGNLGGALQIGLFGFILIFGLRRLVRNDILAAVIASALINLTNGEVVSSGSWLFLGSIFGTVYAVLIFVLLRCGLVATVVAIFFLDALGTLVLGRDWQVWSALSSLATLGLLLSIAGFAFWRSLGGSPLLGEEAR